MRCFVYANLHKACWSIKALNGPNAGRVVAHADKVVLQDATFKVSEAGRQRVLKERRKNVHAGVVGVLVAHRGATWRYADPSAHSRILSGKHWFSTNFVDAGISVTYDPYTGPTFVNRATQEPVSQARAALLSDDRKVYAIKVKEE